MGMRSNICRTTDIEAAEGHYERSGILLSGDEPLTIKSDLRKERLQLEEQNFQRTRISGGIRIVHRRTRL